jgi:hypothetical protein
MGQDIDKIQSPDASELRQNGSRILIGGTADESL